MSSSPFTVSLTIDPESLATQLSEADRRRLLAFATAPARRAFLSRFASDAEKAAHFAEMGRRSGVARRARRKEAACA